MSRILGVDYGSRRIGLAISDIDRRIASPLAIYGRRDDGQDAGYFKKWIETEKVGLIVVGLPAHLSGREGAKAAEARNFGDWLHRESTLSVRFWDERFTTADAEQFMLDAGLTKKQRDARRDMVAAQIMLQSFLDAGCPAEADIHPLEGD